MKLLTGLGLPSFLVAVACAATAGMPQQVSAQSYIVTDLGTLNGGPTSAAFALNEAGYVVGSSRLPPNGFPSHAFVWVGGTMTDLGTLGGGYSSYGYGINNETQVVGHSDVGGGGGQDAFLWEDGVMTALSAPGGTPSSAYDINDAGQITGGFASGAYIWQDGDLIELGTLPGFTGSVGFGINAAGEVVGGAFSCAFCAAHATHWVDGAITDLGVLSGWESSGARAINDVGQIVGASATIIPSVLRATLWDNGEIIDLGAGDGIYSDASGINNDGVIVGYWGTSELFVHHYATKWVDGELIDLNDLIPADSGWVLHEATDINESGQIVGTGINPDGDGHGFLLTPCDFSGGPGEDCDDNGVPDECQSDCNGNGSPDVCDIADGISGDCDGDNVPDECDFGPPITQQPASQEVVVGDFVVFQVSAIGLQLGYQWRKDGIELSDTERIVGTQTSALIILDVQPGDAAEYDCVVTDLLDSSCSFSDSATLTVIVTCPPDFDCDGDVDAFDLAQLLGAWGPCPEPCTPGEPADTCPADLNGDCTVEAFDLALLLGAWG